MPLPSNIQSTLYILQNHHTPLLLLIVYVFLSLWLCHLYVGIFTVLYVVAAIIPPSSDADRRRSHRQYRKPRERITRPRADCTGMFVMSIGSRGARIAAATTAIVRNSSHVSMAIPSAFVFDTEDGTLCTGRSEVGPRCLLHVSVGLELIALVAAIRAGERVQ